MFRLLPLGALRTIRVELVLEVGEGESVAPGGRLAQLMQRGFRDGIGGEGELREHGRQLELVERRRELRRVANRAALQAEDLERRTRAKDVTHTARDPDVVVEL